MAASVPPAPASVPATCAACLCVSTVGRDRPNSELTMTSTGIQSARAVAQRESRRCLPLARGGGGGGLDRLRHARVFPTPRILAQ